MTNEAFFFKIEPWIILEDIDGRIFRQKKINKLVARLPELVKRDN